VSINYKDYPILIVDDEEDFLAIFKRLGDEFNLETERFPSMALNKVMKCTYCVVISDNKMRNSPEMPEDEQAGVNFLKKVGEVNDHPLRVLVTGWSKDGISPSLSSHADINMLIDKLDVITDKEWDEALRKIINSHIKIH
jgi:ActR/RegA family two-component response regulator